MINKVIQSTESFFEEIFGAIPEFASIIPTEDGWELMVEMVIDDEYTKKRAKNDLISVFKVFLNKKAEVLSFAREEIRERGKTIEKYEI